MIFGIHLGLLGYLIYGSGYFTGITRTLLAIDGLGGVIDNLTPYPYPNAHLGFTAMRRQLTIHSEPRTFGSIGVLRVSQGAA